MHDIYIRDQLTPFSGGFVPCIHLEFRMRYWLKEVQASKLYVKKMPAHAVTCWVIMNCFSQRCITWAKLVGQPTPVWLLDGRTWLSSSRCSQWPTRPLSHPNGPSVTRTVLQSHTWSSNHSHGHPHRPQSLTRKLNFPSEWQKSSVHQKRKGYAPQGKVVCDLQMMSFLWESMNFWWIGAGERKLASVFTLVKRQELVDFSHYFSLLVIIKVNV